MEQYLRAFTTYEQDSWLDQLLLAEFASVQQLGARDPRAYCNVRGRGLLSYYLVYSKSPSQWCSLAIILLVYLHHNLLLVSNRSLQNTYQLVTLAVLTRLLLSCSLERTAFEYQVNIWKTRYP
jgi:hypothetical protein